jgi:glycosyltransferase involved in cell wall biosynthesis
VTVWVPSYNHAPYLPAAIESVLGQTFADVELVIVDDGSSDGSLAIAERYAAAHPDRIRLLTHPGHANRGVSESANLAIASTSRPLLTGLASDDVLYRDAVERQVAFLDRHPEAGCVYGYAHMVDETGRRIPDARTFGIDLTGDGRTLERLVQGNTIPSMTAMFRRDCLERAGPFDPDVVYSDWELFVRVAAHSEIAFIPRALAMYRVHPANASVNVTRETNLARAVEVTTLLRQRAERIGGGLAQPRIRATLDLQMAYLRFASDDDEGAAADLAAAFDRDPSLAGDGGWLADWLWGRLLHELLPPDGRDFAAWLAPGALALLAPGARPGFAHEVAAARQGARAIRLARSGRWVAAQRAALAAGARSPRRIADRRLAAVLLDSIAGGRAARAVRTTKRHLLRHR